MSNTKFDAYRRAQKAEERQCSALCAIKMKASIGGEKGRHMLPRLVQNVAEGRTLRVELESKSDDTKPTTKIHFKNLSVSPTQNKVKKNETQNSSRAGPWQL